MTIFDAHTHIHFPQYNKDREDVIKRAQEAGVKMITVGTTLKDSRQAIEWAEKYPDDIWATVGLHPNEAAKEPFDYEKFRELASHQRVVAIGECGLDYYRLMEHETHNAKQKQEDIFQQQIKIAQELKKPLMIHCRPTAGTDDAYEDLAVILPPPASLASGGSDSEGSLKKIIHFFVGSPQIAKKLLDLGCYFTFGGVITFSRDYDAVIKAIPLEKIMLETDAPFVTPDPYRGKRNEPAYVLEVAKKLAEIKGVDYDKVIEQTTANVELCMTLKR